MKTSFAGPLISYGPMTSLPPGQYAVEGVLDYNGEAGPSLFYQGSAVLDPRFVIQKDKGGFIGVQPAMVANPLLMSADVVPSAFGTAKLAALQHMTANVPLVLVTASAAGVSSNVPIIPISGPNAGNVVNAALVLEFGFAFGTTVAGSKVITVADSTAFSQGKPLVIPSLTAAASLLTYVTAILSPTTISVVDAAPFSGTGPIGNGNNWPGGTNGPLRPSAHLPYVAGGFGLFLDAAEALARGVSISASGGAGGSVVVSGYDVYWQPMTETIVLGAGAGVTYGKKAFKAISSVVPRFTDGANNYSVGTSDVFGFNFRAHRWETTRCCWAAASVATSSGFLSYTTPALGDVRGTYQPSTIGGGANPGFAASNGAVAALAMTGNRILLSQFIGTTALVQATPTNPATLFGLTQT